MATIRHAPQRRASGIGRHPYTFRTLLFRVACKSLLMTGRPCLVGGVRGGIDPIPGDLLHPLLLTKLVSPYPLSWPVILPYVVIARLVCDSATTSTRRNL